MNALYDKAREGFLGGDLDWNGATPAKAVFVDAADYTPNLATHDFLDDVPSGARVGTPQTIGTRTITAGVADGDDVTFTGLTGDPSEYILIFFGTGVDATSALVALLDTATGLPITPGGSDVQIQWDSGANKIFKL